MGTAHLEVDAAQVRSFRFLANHLDERLPTGAGSLRRAAWAGLQDSMPRAALLSLHARVEATPSSALDDPALVQVWGPRFSVYVVAADDVAAFTLGRLPTDSRGRRRAEETAARLRDLLDVGQAMSYGQAGRALDVHPNSLRYASSTGMLQLHWDGARQPTIRRVDPPDVDERAARHDLARRWLHVAGPTTPDAFARWANVGIRQARTTFEELVVELIPLRTSVGDRWALASDEAALRAAPVPTTGVRLLPSGDAWWLLHGADRALVVQDEARRDLLWTPRVWPGALVVDGEVVGTWRRAQASMDVDAWRPLSDAERHAVEAAADDLPLPGLDRSITVTWGG